MQERDLLRQAIAPCLPDPEQVRQNILRECAPKARRKSLRTYLPAAACIALLLTAAVLFSQWSPLPNHPAAAETQPPTLAAAAPETQPPTPAAAPKAHFNELGAAIFASRRYYDPKETFEKQLTFAQVVEYLGRDVRPTFLPSDLHAIDVKDMSFTMIYKNDGTILYDSIGFYYQETPGNPDYNPLERKLVISVSKMQLWSDCIYVWPDDMQKTDLNGHAANVKWTTVRTQSLRTAPTRPLAITTC